MPLSSIIAVICFAAAAPGGLLAYVAVPDGQAELHLLQMDGGGVESAGVCGADTAPVWSSDSGALAYAAPTGTGQGIAVYQAQGGAVRTLASAFAHCSMPCWDREGARLAYAAAHAPDAPTQLAVFDLASGKERVWGGELRAVYDPAWMPAVDLFRRLNPDDGFTWKGVDTRRLLEEAFSTGVVLCTALTTHAGRLTTEIMLATETQSAPLLALLGSESARFSEWRVLPNRNGSMIAFESNDGGDRELFVLNRRGLIDVSNHRAADWHPVWSPDGQWLAFESFRRGSRGVYRLFPDTMRVDTVDAPEGAQSWGAAWSPDGRDIAFLSDRSGASEIYLLRAGSETPEQLSRDGVAKSALAWQPEARK